MDLARSMSHSTAYWAGAFYGVAEGSMTLALHVLGTLPGLGILVHTLTDHKHDNPHFSRCLKFDVDLEEAPKSGTYAIIQDLPSQLSEPSGPKPDASSAYYSLQNSTRPQPLLAAPSEQQGLLGSSSAMGRTQQGPMLLNSQGSAEISSYPVHHVSPDTSMSSFEGASGELFRRSMDVSTSRGLELEVVPEQPVEGSYDMISPSIRSASTSQDSSAQAGPSHPSFRADPILTQLPVSHTPPHPPSPPDLPYLRPVMPRADSPDEAERTAHLTGTTRLAAGSSSVHGSQSARSASSQATATTATSSNAHLQRSGSSKGSSSRKKGKSKQKAR